MAFAETVTCDICGAVKGPTNGWWIGEIGHTEDRTPEFTVRPSSHKPDPTVRHYCSQSCVNIALSEWMQEQKEVSHAGM